MEKKSTTVSINRDLKERLEELISDRFSYVRDWSDVWGLFIHLLETCPIMPDYKDLRVVLKDKQDKLKNNKPDNEQIK